MMARSVNIATREAMGIVRQTVKGSCLVLHGVSSVGDVRGLAICEVLNAVGIHMFSPMLYRSRKGLLRCLEL